MSVNDQIRLFIVRELHWTGAPDALTDDYPLIEADTADFAYARLQRMSEEVPTGYDDAALDRFAAKAREWQKRGDAYIFMINGAKVRAPAAALALQERLAV